MLMLNNSYNAVSCNGDLVSTCGGYDPKENFGFVLIDDHIVPNSFVDFIADALSDTIFYYGEVLPIRDYVPDDLWANLDTDERAVLGPVIVLLIEQGRVVIKFQSDACDDEVICSDCGKKGH